MARPADPAIRVLLVDDDEAIRRLTRIWIDHDRRFEVRAKVDGDEVGVGTGRSKKEAEQAAAERALEDLRR